MKCLTCGLEVRYLKIEAHTQACRDWRRQIENKSEHDVIARYWEAASSIR